MQTDLTARWTTGRTLPGSAEASDPANVLVYLSEDSAGMWRSRLTVAGGDLDRALHLVGKGDPDYPIDVTLEDIEKITEEVRSRSCRVLVLDALKDFTRVKNDHHEDKVREALMPLKRLAREEDIAVVGIVHFGKSPRSAADAVMGSAAWRDGARSVLAVGWLDGSEGPRGVAVAKGNLAPKPDGLTFDLEGGATARVVWGDKSDPSLVADDLVPRGPQSEEERSALDEAREFVVAELSSHGPMSPKELQRRAEGAGVSWRTVERARRAEGVKSEAVRDSQGKVTGWALLLPEGTSDA